MALFFTDFSGRRELSEQQQKLAQMLSKLSKLSEEYNVTSHPEVHVAPPIDQFEPPDRYTDDKSSPM
ncbi:hypothetical protein BC835DRAFT_1422958 [Cytidiella melzeri]|nr:hypothetical protein BC835DRAFT_1422958 [Cytidiella melzeri]